MFFFFPRKTLSLDKTFTTNPTGTQTPEGERSPTSFRAKAATSWRSPCASAPSPRRLGVRRPPFPRRRPGREASLETVPAGWLHNEKGNRSAAGAEDGADPPKDALPDTRQDVATAAATAPGHKHAKGGTNGRRGERPPLVKKSKRYGGAGTGPPWRPQKRSREERGAPGRALRGGGAPGGQRGPRRRAAGRRAEGGRGGGCRRPRRRPEAGTSGRARGPQRPGALGPAKTAGSAPKTDARPRPSPRPALSFKPPSPSPCPSPMRSWTRAAAGPRPALHPASPRQAHPRGSRMPRRKTERRPLPELPRVEALAVPPVPATLRHYRRPRSSTRRPGVLYWPDRSSISSERGGDSRDL